MIIIAYPHEWQHELKIWLGPNWNNDLVVGALLPTRQALASQAIRIQKVDSPVLITDGGNSVRTLDLVCC